MKLANRLALSALLFSGTAVSLLGDVLISENFEGLTMSPFQSPTETGGDGTDWTSGLPAGWSMSFSGPVGNPVEFQGWHVMDVDSWIATEGNQERATWSRGGVGTRNSALVADPDAYDDGTNIDDAQFNTWVTTPSLDLGLLVPGSARIAFDSFWRNEVTQIGKLDVSYDGGGTYQTILTYDSNALADGLVIDERIDLAVDNPATGSLIFRFGLTDGSNDWWWAVDNVAVSASVIPEPTTTALGALGLALLLSARRRAS